MTDPATTAGSAGNAAASPRSARRRRDRAGAFRLLWAGSVVLPVVALLLGGVSAWNEVVGYETEKMVRTIGIVNEQTLRLLETQQTVLAALEAHIDGVTWDEIAADPEMHRFIHRLAEAVPSVLVIGMIAPDGRLIASSDTPDPPRDLHLSDRAFVRAFPPGAAAALTYVSEVLVGRVSGREQIFLARARRGPDGQADGGILTTAFAPAYAERFFAEVAETAATGFLLVRDDGSVLARHPVRVASPGEHLAESDPVLTVGRSLPAGAPTQVVRSGSLLGGFHLLAVRRAGDTPVLIAHGVDPAVVRSAWLGQMTPLAIGALGAMVLLMLLTGQAQRRLAAERAALLRRSVGAEQGRQQAQARAELEARLRQTEKLAALGHLSAGVAHDFNNLLQTIIISAETLTGTGSSTRSVPETGALILRVTERGMALTRRMLEYGRHGAAPGADVLASLRSVRELLTRSFGPLYHFRFDLGAAAGLQAGCPAAEFETALINLAVNARDAMPDGGDIDIVVTGAEETRPRAESGLKPGRYLRIAVTDTGHGLDQKALAQAGEALYTTKPRGEGTGLGLAMARGFARRSGGKLELASMAGRGTTVTLWLAAA